MEQADIVVVGGGVVGLSVAAQVSGKGRHVVLVERHESFGQETSSRNSEVIHAGIYYPAGTLKARLCVEGNTLLYRLCEQQGIPYAPLGKLIVAVRKEQLQDLDDLMEKGLANEAPSLRRLSAREVRALEPHVAAVGAILSPRSGIVDSHRLMAYFETTARQRGALLAYGCEVETIEREDGGYRVGIRDTDGDILRLRTAVLINCAGLESGNLAQRAGIDIEQAHYRIHYCKGEYFQVGNGKHRLARRLIYPTPPRPGSVGIHTVPDMQGMMRLGPYDYYVENLDYQVREEHRALFHDAVRSFLPFIELEDLTPGMAGIHPKTQAPGETMRDFAIVHEVARGLPGLINLIGIESPGLTSSPAIGRYVAAMVKDMGIA